MILTDSLPDIKSFVNIISNSSTDENNRKYSLLTRIQNKFIAFCMTYMIIFGCFCFESMEKASLGKYKSKSLGALLKYAKIPWLALWKSSVKYLISHAGNSGFLVIDDSNRNRAKGTSKLYGVHKVKDKKTAGYAMAQNIVLLAFVTQKITFTVGFELFRPDPAWYKWKEEDIRQRLAGIKRANRPNRPDRDHNYPMRTEIALKLIKAFKDIIPEINIEAIVADSAYLNKNLIAGVEKIFPNVQFISQLRNNNIVSDNSKISKSVKEYFANKVPKDVEINIRGMGNKTIQLISARLFIRSQNRKMHIVALKYAGEEEYRYLAATNLSWQGITIVRAYSMRWLVEVVIEDWKEYSGWGQMAFQRDVDTVCRGIQLSFLVDHFICSHNLQLKQLQAEKSLFTTGSVQRFLQNKALLLEVSRILDNENPKERFNELTKGLDKYLDLRLSRKHMSGYHIGEFRKSPSLALRIDTCFNTS